ncbi:DUF6069 family protein [Plantactinospora solaniradicis]|uniref:DUF6069 family protein n=1 Tax=Plantactinospora solaniradicis TaxID=1723736 RepID=A0ABW1KFU7_9ACTN
MTNDMQQSETTKTTARRTGRAITVAAGAAGALLLWVVNDPWAGIDLTVRQGDATQHIDPVVVAAAALVAGLAAWGLLALLERTVRRPARTFRIVALIVLVLSLAGPLGSGVGTSSRLVLLAMHLTVGAALIIGLPGRRNHRGCR